jgi:carbamoyl-phosphate synthase large subunit
LRKVNALVTASGTIVAQGIIKSLKLANSKGKKEKEEKENEPISHSYRIVAADMSAEAVGLYRSDVGVLVPAASAPDYIDSIVRVTKREGIDAIFVGAEEEMASLSMEKRRIEEETGAVVVTNPPEVLSIGMDKWETFRFLNGKRLPCAESALPEEAESFVREHGFPVVVKPREGHGSVHFYLARDIEQVNGAIAAIREAGWRPMLQENLPDAGQEFTAGVTVDKRGKRVMSSIAMRRTLKGGQTYKGIIDDFPEVRKVAEEIALALGARGAVNIQSRMEEGVSKAFEINPRFSASCPMRAVAGVNEPDIVTRNTLFGEEVTVKDYERLMCMRYWNEVYLPLSTLEKMRVGRAEDLGTVSFVPDYF